MNKIKERLKKLAFFDYVLIGILLTGVVIFAYIFFRKPAYITVTVKVGEEGLLWGPNYTKGWFSHLFTNGMVEKDGLGRIQAEVIDILSYDTDPNKKSIYLTLNIKSIHSKASDQYTFKGKPILVGYPIQLHLDRLNVEGLIVDVDGVGKNKEMVTLEIGARMMSPLQSPFLETYGVSPSYSEAIKVGDTVYDSKGNVLIEVVGKTSENAKRIVTTSDGRTVVGTNPLLRDVNLTLKVNAMTVNDKYYLFDDVPLIIGQKIPITIPFLSIYPEITKITPVK